MNRSAHQLWLGKYSVPVAWLGVLLALFAPANGSRLLVCWFKSATGLPCPGCGLTRSLSFGVRGMFLESWNAHPMGLPILALFLFTAAQSLCPGSVRERLRSSFQAHCASLRAVYLVFVTAFVTFGAIRALICWFGWLHSGSMHILSFVEAA